MTGDELDAWLKRESEELMSSRTSLKVPSQEQQERARRAFSQVLRAAGRMDIRGDLLATRLGPGLVELQFSQQRLLSDWDGTDNDLAGIAEAFAESLLEAE